jgi:hypothetical protein
VAKKRKEPTPKTVCLDFDGVLHAYSRGWGDGSCYDAPIEGALSAVTYLQLKGLNVVVQTARQDLDAVRDWLFQHGFPEMRVTNEKPIALAYIDDRGITFQGDWRPVLATVEAMLLAFESGTRPA